MEVDPFYRNTGIFIEGVGGQTAGNLHLFTMRINVHNFGDSRWSFVGSPHTVEQRRTPTDRSRKHGRFNDVT